ncbi:hypothetical protein KJ068_14510, partial [bacterium]|nr:hypothetical protein [bacterium]
PSMQHNSFYCFKPDSSDFNKEFFELTREEYIALVAMIIGPNALSVSHHPEKNAERVRRIERLLRGECQPAGLNDVNYEQCSASP